METIKHLEAFVDLMSEIKLTPAEIKVSVNLCKGLTASQIADLTHKSVHTIRGQIQTVKEKLNCQTQQQVILKLMEVK